MYGLPWETGYSQGAECGGPAGKGAGGAPYESFSWGEKKGWTWTVIKTLLMPGVPEPGFLEQRKRDASLWLLLFAPFTSFHCFAGSTEIRSAKYYYSC